LYPIMLRELAHRVVAALGGFGLALDILAPKLLERRSQNATFAITATAAAAIRTTVSASFEPPADGVDAVLKVSVREPARPSSTLTWALRELFACIPVTV
jgi:hypothetical protein